MRDGDDERSAVPVLPPVHPRKLAKVPFVELADGALQGVVSSGSDPARVYVSSIRAGTHAYTCSTNNNRPCGGLRGRLCNHLAALVNEAVLQYGAPRVAAYLRIPLDPDAAEPTGADLVGRIDGAAESSPAGPVFARFLQHLAYLEVPTTAEPVPEMQWFVAPRGHTP